MKGKVFTITALLVFFCSVPLFAAELIVHPCESLSDSLSIQLEWVENGISQQSSLRFQEAPVIIDIPVDSGLFSCRISCGHFFLHHWLVADGQNITLQLILSPPASSMSSKIRHEASRLYRYFSNQADSVYRRIQTLHALVHAYSRDRSKGGEGFLNKSKTELEKTLQEWKLKTASWRKQHGGNCAWRLAGAKFKIIPDPLLSPLQQKEEILQYWFTWFDPTDEVVFNSIFYKQKIENYLHLAGEYHAFKAEPLKTIVDMMMAKVIEDDKFSVPVMQWMWQWSMQQGLDELAMYIDLNYQINRCGAGSDENLLRRLQNYKKLAIGKAAPDIVWMNANLKTASLYDIKSKYTLLAFWGTWCPHCNEQMPRLSETVQKHPELKAVCIAVEEHQAIWQHRIQSYPGLIHLYGAGKWDNDWVREYAILGTPTYYLLDADKKIVAKTASLDQLQEFLDFSF